MNEIFKSKKGYEGFYDVSNLGRIKSIGRLIHQKADVYRNGRIMKPQKRGEYLGIKFSKDGVRKMYLIHRLIAEVFIPNPDNLKEVNHLDGNKFNNAVSNLEWSTHKNNCIHARDILKNTYKGEKHHSAKLKEQDVIDMINDYKRDNYSYAELGRIYNITPEAASCIIRRKTWKHLKIA